MADTLSLSEAAGRFLRHISVEYTQQTVTAYRQSLNLLIAVIQNNQQTAASGTALSSLTPQHLKQYADFLRAERSIETEHLYTRGLLAFLEYSHDQGWHSLGVSTLANYIEQHRRPKERRLHEPPVDEIETVIRYIQTAPVPPPDDSLKRERLRVLRDKAFIIVLAESGLRVSEICALRRSSLDVKQHLLTVPGTHNPTLPISPTAVSAIQHYLGERRELDAGPHARSSADLPLFARHDKRAGRRVLPISRWTGANIVDDWTCAALPPDVRSRLAEEGRTITPHMFRHFFVVKTLLETGDINTTQQLARHSDRATTRRYLVPGETSTSE